MTTDGATTTYTYDRNNRLRNTVTVKSGTTKTTTYTYDGNGNCLTESGETSTQNTYNLLNQLTGSIVNGVTTQYTYRPDGLRASKLTGGIKTEHVWDGASIALDIAGTNYTKYVRGINLISSALNSAASQYFLYNAHGDVVQLVNTSGSVWLRATTMTRSEWREILLRTTPIRGATAESTTIRAAARII